ncbi:MAG TPA: response regulator transcription factor [Alphaproteobacteria bacterium]|nr:response regulator transcription factor [Alphaproteobacteria bacterium]
MSEVKHRILIVDDEAAIRRFLRIGLGNAGFKVDEAEDGKQAVRMAKSLKPDLMLLDLGLPEMDGQEVITQVRADGYTGPILILSVRSDQQDIVQALDRGADDYLTKPFGLEELLARTRSLLRRSVQQATGGDTTITIEGCITMDMMRHEVKVGDQLVDLSPKEFKLLKVLASNANKVLTHRAILQEVWGPAHTEDQQYLRVYMGQLRKKLAINGEEPAYIRTLQGVGYMFDTTVEKAA